MYDKCSRLRYCFFSVLEFGYVLSNNTFIPQYQRFVL